jgi:hypothetical protein
METVLKQNTLLYKRMKSASFNITKTEPTWFGINDQVLATYGPNLHTVSCGRDIKLLNIMSWNFRIDLMEKIYTTYSYVHFKMGHMGKHHNCGVFVIYFLSPLCYL